MNRSLRFLFFGWILTSLLVIPQRLRSQCDPVDIVLPAAMQVPVNGVADPDFCHEITFDLSVAGVPFGLSIDIFHQAQEDLGIFINACGNTLNVLQRPYMVNNCAPGCPCSSVPAPQLGTMANPVTITFQDGISTDPENGMSFAGGNYGVTNDDACGVGSPGVNSFADLFAGCSGQVTAEICIFDHAGAGMGVVSGISLLFPNAPVCGCTDPNATNYDPSATIDDGSCVTDCSMFSVTASTVSNQVCAGADFTLDTEVMGALNVDYTWTATNGGAAFLDDVNGVSPVVTIPPGFTGNITYTVTAEAGSCTETDDVTITVNPTTVPLIEGDNVACGLELATIGVTNGPFVSYEWSTNETTASINVGPGTYTVVAENANGCFGEADFTVTSAPGVTPNITGPTAICPDGAVDLALDATYATYAWSTGGMGPTETITSAQTVSVTVTDTDGCSGEASYVVASGAVPNPDISGALSICPGSNTTLSVADTFTTYSWSTGGMTNQVTVSAIGDYSVTVTNADGCSAADTVTVVEDVLQPPTIAGSTQLCPGGSLTLNVVETYATYQWSTGSTTSIATVSSAGTYGVTVTDGGTCSSEASITISDAPPVMVEITGDDVLCSGATGALSATSGFVNYVWGNLESTPDITIDQPDLYSVTVQDANGCTGTASLVVMAGADAEPTFTGDAVFCEGGSTTIGLTEAYATYAWSDNTGGTEITVMDSGTYSVTVTNDDGCVGMATIDISEAPNPTPMITGGSTICEGQTTTLGVAGAFQSYSWSTGSSMPSITVDMPGTYGVTVTDANNCSGTASADLSTLPLPEPTIDGLTEFCEGETVELSVPGSFVDYLWSTSQQTPAINITAPGTYTVTVTDANNCEGEASLTVGQLPQPPLDILGDLQLCTPDTTTLSATAGYSSYSWNTGAVTDAIELSQAGAFSLTVTDGNGCTNEASVQVTASPAPTPNINGNLAFCEGASTILTGSSGFSSYAWSTGGTTPSISVNQAGPVMLTVTNSQGCTGTASVNLSTFSLPMPSISGDTAFCEGASTLLNAGAGFVSYQWSNGPISPGVTVDTSGTFSVVVTDGNGCQGTDSVEVTENPNPTPGILGQSFICADSTNMLEADPNFDAYAWSTGAVTDSISVVGPGNYTLTVTDENGCTGTTSFSVIAGPAGSAAILGDLDVCEGQTTILSLSGAFATYNWSTGETMDTILVGAAGEYSVTVTDTLGCIGIDTVSVEVTSSPVIDIQGTPSFCTGGSTVLSVPASFTNVSWSTSATTNSITVDAPGTYTVMATLTGGCSGAGSVMVAELPPPTAAITGDLSFCEGGSTTLNGPPGMSSYLWTGGGTQPTLNVNTPGDYSLTITGGNGCLDTTTVTVSETMALVPTINGDLAICAGDSTLLSVPENFATYTWSDTSMSDSLWVNTAGTYSVTVTDENGCEGEETVSVAVTNLPNPAIVGDDLLCPSDTATLELAFTIFDAYTWSNGSDQPQTTITTPGTYAVSVTDVNGCVGVDSITVTPGTAPMVTLDGPMGLCPGAPDTLLATPGLASYAWSTGSAQSFAPIVGGGTYQLTVTNVEGCTAVETITIQDFVPDPVTISGTTSFCPGGSAALEASAGFASYSWSTMADTQGITVSSPGTYGVTVVDANGCENTASVMVTEEAELSPVIVGNLNLCEGETTTLEVGSGFATYLWTGGGSGATLPVDAAGTYSVTVTDSQGCFGSDTVVVSVQASPTPTISGAMAICDGGSTTLDGTGPFASYLWTGGATDPTLTVDTAGTYGLTVTDANGCQGETTFALSVLPSPVPGISGENLICPGANTMLTAEAGFASYAWNTGEDTPTITVDTAGTYSVAVTNADGCTGESSFEVMVNALPSAQISGSLSFCTGGATTLSGPDGLVAYSWTTGSDQPSITVSTPGDYTLEVTDANGCTNSSTVTVSESDGLSPSITGDLDLCEGESTVLQAGTGFASYAWSDGSAADTLAVTASGAYSVTVTDADGCSGADTVTVMTLAPPMPMISGDTALCAGNTVSLTAPAGFATYQWTGGGDQPTLLVDTAGTYGLTVTDADGCVGTTSLEVMSGTPPQVTLDGPAGLCAGAQDTLFASTGLATYAWSTGSAEAFTLIDTAGTYTLTVTNAEGCTSTEAFVVGDLPPPAVSISGSASFCPGGSANLSATPGFVSYEWSNNALTPNITVNAEGTYTVQVTDAGGCTNSASIAVTEEAELSPSITGDLDLCEGESTVLQAGTGFASYAWSDGSAADTLAVTASGAYSVTVTDADGCSGADTVTVMTLAPPMPMISGDTALCAGNTVSLTAPAGFATYQWTGGGDQPTLLVDTAGTYGLTVTDADGCVGTTSLEVMSGTPPQVTLDGPVGLCAGAQDTLFASTGLATYAWSTGSAEAFTLIDTAGTYTLTVTNAEGCTSTEAFVVGDLPPPAVSISGSASFCPGGSANLSATPGFVSYEWSNNALTPSITVNAEGTYTVQVTDAGGCTNSASITVTEEAELSPSITGDLDLCEGESTVLQAGTGFASYAWSDGTAADTLAVTASGAYSVTVTDADGCSGADTVTVMTLAPPMPMISGDTALCAGNTASLTAPAGFATYQWTGGGDQPTLLVDTAGTYGLTVTDADGCVGAASATVVETNIAPPAISGPAGLCPGASTILIAEAGFAGYSWSDGTMLDTLAADAAGTYSLTVTDAEGCSAEATFELPALARPVANPGAAQAIDCETTTVVLGGEHGGLDLAFSWEGPGIDGSNVGLPFPEVAFAGTYTLVVTDQDSGCTSEPVSVVVDDLTNEPNVVIAEPEEINCNTPTITLDGSASDNGPDVVYQWYDGNAQPIAGATGAALEVTLPQAYTLAVTDTLSGCSAQVSVTVMADLDPPTADAGEGGTLTCAVTNLVLDAGGSQAGDTIVYAWTTSTGNLVSGVDGTSPTVDAGGWYLLTVLNEANGCVAADSVQVLENNDLPMAEAGAGGALDCFNTTVGLNGSGSTGTRYTYQWLLDGGPLPGADQLSLTVGEPGLYTLVVTDTTNACVQTDEVLVEELESAPDSLNIAAVGPNCFGTGDGSIVINEVIGGTSPFLYSFDGSNFSTATSFNGLDGGTYLIAVEDANGCTYSTEVVLPEGNDMEVNLGDDQVIKLGETVDLFPEVLPEGVELAQISWSSLFPLECMDCLNQVGLSLTDAFEFSLTVADTNGCTAEDKVIIFVNKERGIYVPTAFSPNGDEQNDVFLPFFGADVVEIHSFQVFNRWGDLVHEAKDVPPTDSSLGWDGNFNGQPANAAVFVWYAEVEFLDGEVVIFEGDTVLIR